MAVMSLFKASWLMCLGLVMMMLLAPPKPAEAHMAMMYPPPRGGFGTKEFNWKIHVFIGYQGFKFPCGGYGPGPVTNMKAGQVIPVKFWTTEITNVKQKVNKNIPQARHGGGLCEFSLSYDGGKTFNVFATYSETCPDAAFDWQRRCLFSWSWTAHLVPQFYHNCADITMQGVKNGKLPAKKMQIYDFKGKGIKQGVTFKGDGNSKSRGPGPIPSELKANIRPSK